MDDNIPVPPKAEPQKATRRIPSGAYWLALAGLLVLLSIVTAFLWMTTLYGCTGFAAAGFSLLILLEGLVIAGLVRLYRQLLVAEAKFDDFQFRMLPKLAEARASIRALDRQSVEWTEASNKLGHWLGWKGKAALWLLNRYGS